MVYLIAQRLINHLPALQNHFCILHMPGVQSREIVLQPLHIVAVGKPSCQDLPLRSTNPVQPVRSSPELHRLDKTSNPQQVVLVHQIQNPCTS